MRPIVLCAASRVVGSLASACPRPRASLALHPAPPAAPHDPARIAEEPGPAARSPEGLVALLADYDRRVAAGAGESALEAARGAIDAMAAQKDADASRLFWPTDLAEALAVARATGEPILPLRLLGRLDEEVPRLRLARRVGPHVAFVYGVGRGVQLRRTSIAISVKRAVGGPSVRSARTKVPTS